MLHAEWTGKAILFDLDGTLIESMSTIERHTRIWAARHGLDPDQTLAAWHGRRDSDVIADYVPPHQVADEIQWMRELSCRDTEGITAAAGSRHLLHSLRAEAWGIVTSGEREVATCRIAAAELPEPRILVAAEDVHNGKPDPEGFLRAARQLGTTPDQCLVFEDAMAGIQAARTAGMRAVLVGDESQHSDDIWRVSSLKNVDITQSGGERFHLRLVFTGYAD